MSFLLVGGGARLNFRDAPTEKQFRKKLMLNAAFKNTLITVFGKIVILPVVAFPYGEWGGGQTHRSCPKYHLCTQRFFDFFVNKIFQDTCWETQMVEVE